MKVVHVSKYYWPRYGGIENQVQMMAEELCKKGMNTKVLAAGNQSYSTDLNGVEVNYLPNLFNLMSAPIVPRLITELKNVKADIVHLHLPNPFAVLAYLLVKPKVKLVVSWHAPIRNSVYHLYKPFQRRILQKADLIIGATPSHLKELKEFRSKCKVIPYGIRVDEEDISSNSRNILFVGRLVAYKGVRYLIEAMKNIDGQLTIIGDGPLRKKLQNMTTALALNDKINFVGEVNEEQKENYLSQAGVLVLPSIDKREAFGIVQIEAMARGIPVVSTNLGNGVDMVNIHNKTGLTVPPKNAGKIAGAVNQLLLNPDVSKKLGDFARERVQSEYNCRLMVNRLLEAYWGIP